MANFAKINNVRKLSSVQETIKSFSMFIFDSNIDWVLLVEGSSDKYFYEKFTSNIKIFYGTREKHPKSNINDDFKEYNYETAKISEYVQSGIDNKKNIYGIVDRDYDNKTYTGELGNRLKITDAHSLETMMIKYATPSGFDKCIKKTFFYKNRNGHSYNEFSNKFVLIDSFTEKALLIAFKIGMLRKTFGNKLPYTNTISICNYFFDCLKICEGEKTGSGNLEKIQYSFEFDEDMFIDKLLSLQDPQKYDYYDIEKVFLDSKYSIYDPYSICRGHDVMNLIEAMFKKNESLNQTDAEKENIEKYFKDRTDENSKFATEIIKKYDASFFKKSFICKWINEIEENYNKIESKSIF